MIVIRSRCTCHCHVKHCNTIECVTVMHQHVMCHVTCPQFPASRDFGFFGSTMPALQELATKVMVQARVWHSPPVSQTFLILATSSWRKANL